VSMALRTDILCRFSAKISHITPDDLPRNLHQQLVDLMPVTMNGVTGYIRPGCVYLTVAFGVDAADAKTLQVCFTFARGTCLCPPAPDESLRLLGVWCFESSCNVILPITYPGNV
jgi:hypothetical protein